MLSSQAVIRSYRRQLDDVPLADFARVFGYDGVFDTFFNENLADAGRYVARSRGRGGPTR